MRAFFPVCFQRVAIVAIALFAAAPLLAQSSGDGFSDEMLFAPMQAGGPKKPRPTPTPRPVPVPGDPDWTGASSTTWSATGNWSPAATPGPADVARFTGTFSNQPNLTAAASAGGLWMTGTLGQNVVISNTGGTSILTLNGTTINSIAGLGILVDNTDTKTLTISAPVTLGGAQTWRNNSSNLLTISGAVNTNTNALTIDGTGNTTLSGVISSSGAITVAGSGVVTFSNTGNTYTGTTTISQGTLSASDIVVNMSKSSLGNATSAVVLGSASTTGTLSYTGAAATYTRGFTVNAGGGGITNAGTGLLTIGTGGITNNGNLTFATNANGITVNSVISGTGSVTMNSSGAGALTLSGANTYSGDTTISAGTLALGASNVIPDGVGKGNVIVNGTLDMGKFSETINGLSGSGVVDNTSAGGPAGADDTLTVGNNNASATFSGTLQNSGGHNLILTKIGTGTQVLSGTNTYTGTTTVSAGVLELASANALPGGIGSTGGTSALTLSGGVIGLAAGNFSRGLGTGATQVDMTAGGGFAAYGADRIVNLGGASAQVTWNMGSFVGDNNTFILGASTADHTVDFQNPISLNTNPGSITRTIQVDNGSAAIDAKLSGIISGASTKTFQKTGTGTLELTGTNTYTGATQVTAGTLFVDGNNTSATGATTVSNAGTILGGIGTIGSTVTVNSGAALQGGNGSTGQTLTLRSAVTMNTGSIIELALGSSFTHSTLAMTNSAVLTFATSQDFKFIDLGATTGTYTGLITGVANPGTALNSWVIDSSNQNYAGTFSWDSTNGGEIDLNLTSVPEPGTWFAAALGVVGVCFTQRRRFVRLFALA